MKHLFIFILLGLISLPAMADDTIPQPSLQQCVNDGGCAMVAIPYTADDYKSGAYPVPEAPVPYQNSGVDLSGINEKDGEFSAYDLPAETVRQNTLGQYKFKN